MFINFYLGVIYFGRDHKSNDIRRVVGKQRAFKIQLANQLFTFKDVSTQMIRHFSAGAAQLALHKLDITQAMMSEELLMCRHHLRSKQLIS